MKIIGISLSPQKVASSDVRLYEKAEAHQVWQLYQNGLVREVYLRTDSVGSVLLLEVPTIAQAHCALEELPLVQAGLLEFDLVPLAPWSEMANLFCTESLPLPPWWPRSP